MSFASFLWDVLIIFMFIVLLMILFQILIDLFRDHSLSGWGKTGWIILIIIFPFLGMFIYLIARGKGMAERRQQDVVAMQQQQDAYIKQVAGSKSPTDQIADAKQLLDSGAISQAEFDQIKAKALAS
jgi:TRAP-type C4-dicarboxylate transport system permease small subunit